MAVSINNKTAISAPTSDLINLIKPIQIGGSNTLGIIGDQITAQFFSKSADGFTVSYMAHGYITWAQVLSSQRLRITSNQASTGATVYNDGVNSIIQQIQRAIADKVTHITCMAGYNDLIKGIPLPQIKRDYLAAINLATDAGIKVWWLTCTPVNDTQADSSKMFQQALLHLNQWIKKTALTYNTGVRVIDVSNVVGTVTSGAYNWKTGYSRTDLITPKNVGAYYIGKEIARVWKAELPATFELPSLTTDNTTATALSDNVIDNHLFTRNGGVTAVNSIVGGTGYTSAPAVSFTGGGGTGAAGVAFISGGAIAGVTMTNTGEGYTSAPTVTFIGGGGTGASATAILAAEGFAGSSSRVVPSITARADGCGNDLNVSLNFPTSQAAYSLVYSNTMASPLSNHMAPNDTFQVACEITAGGDGIVSIGPVVRSFGAANKTFHSCEITGQDANLPEQFTGIFVTPPYKKALNTASAQVTITAINNTSGAAGVTGSYKVGRMLGDVQLPFSVEPAIKKNVKFNPGHYVTVYPFYRVSSWASQDGFNTDTATVPQRTAAWRGVQRIFTWKELEPTKNNYDFSRIQEWLDYLHNWVNKNGINIPKKLIVYLFADTYLNPSSYSIPDYILNDPEYEGGTYGHNLHPTTQAPRGYKLKYWVKSVQDRYIALGNALAVAFDKHPALEAFRLDETSPGETLETNYGSKKTEYIEGQIRIASEINKAFKETTVVMGFNFLSDGNFARTVKLMLNAGVAFGAVDIIQSVTGLSGKYQSYDWLKSVAKYAPVFAQVDSGNYMSNASTSQSAATIHTTAQSLNASHISWYRMIDDLNNASNYKHLTAYLNGLQTQDQWEADATKSTGTNTFKPLLLRG